MSGSQMQFYVGHLVRLNCPEGIFRLMTGERLPDGSIGLIEKVHGDYVLIDFNRGDPWEVDKRFLDEPPMYGDAPHDGAAMATDRKTRFRVGDRVVVRGLDERFEGLGVECTLSAIRRHGSWPFTCGFLAHLLFDDGHVQTCHGDYLRHANGGA